MMFSLSFLCNVLNIQVISVEGDPAIEDKLSGTDIIWTGADMSDLRIHGTCNALVVKDFLARLEKYHLTNSGSAYSLLGYLFLSMHRKSLSSHHAIPTFILAGPMSSGKSSLVNHITSVLPHEFCDNIYRYSILNET